MGVFDLFKKKPNEPPSRGRAGECAAAGAAEAAPKQGLFGMLRSALKKTHDVLNTDIRDLFKREGRLVDDEFLGELFAILVKTDMGTGPAGADSRPDRHRLSGSRRSHGGGARRA